MLILSLHFQEWDEAAASAVRTPWMLCWNAAGEPLWLDTSSNERRAYVKGGPHPTHLMTEAATQPEIGMELSNLCRP
jgi:hypothetical protein